MQYRFAAFDLDGTLLNDKKELTPATRAALAQLQARGVQLILASGRHPRGVLPLAQELDFPAQGGIVLCFNGGCAIDCRTGEALVRRCLDRAVAVSVIRACRAYDLSPLSYMDTALLCEDAQNEYAQLEARLNHLAAAPVADLTQALPEHIGKLLLVAPPQTVCAALGRLQQAFSVLCDIYCSAPYFIEVMTPGVNKATALQELLPKLGGSPEALVSFGDGQNDIPMLELSAVGVVMENASSDMKEHGNLITRSCNDDGVAVAIGTLWGLPASGAPTAQKGVKPLASALDRVETCRYTI